MTKATREALKDVARILHEAGWDQADTGSGDSTGSTSENVPIQLVPTVSNSFYDGENAESTGGGGQEVTAPEVPPDDVVAPSTALDADLRDKLKEAREALEMVGLPEADKGDVADDLDKLTAELTKPQQDVRRVRRLLMRIRDLAPTVAAIPASASRIVELLNRP